MQILSQEMKLTFSNSENDFRAKKTIFKNSKTSINFKEITFILTFSLTFFLQFNKFSLFEFRELKLNKLRKLPYIFNIYK